MPPWNRRGGWFTLRRMQRTLPVSLFTMSWTGRSRISGYTTPPSSARGRTTRCRALSEFNGSKVATKRTKIDKGFCVFMANRFVSRMAYQNVLLETKDRISTLTINRPDKRNALNHATREEILHVLD